MDIVIDSGIPIPKERPKFKKYIDAMEVGQSFRVGPQHWTSLRNAASNMNKRTKKRFVVNKVKELIDLEKANSNQALFVRIWRTK